MAIKVGGTTVIDDSRNVDNIGTIKGLTYPSADGTVGQFMKTDGSGSLSFATVESDPTLATLTKSFVSGETASITLPSAITTAPVVSVIKEVAQVGVTSKGTWDVASDAGNYERYDTATATTLTPSVLGYGSLSSVTKTDVSYYTGAQADVESLYVREDGLKHYTLDQTGDMFEYTWSTAHDITTASFTRSKEPAGVSGVNVNNTRGFHFKPDGTKLYFAHNSTGATQGVLQYSLSTAWDISTMTFNSNKYLAFHPSAVTFSEDGTRMYVANEDSNTIVEYIGTTAWDLSSFGNAGATVSTPDGQPSTVSFSSDGTYMYVGGISGSSTASPSVFILSTPWDLSTAVRSASDDINLYDLFGGNGTGPSYYTYDISFARNGLDMYVLGRSSSRPVFKLSVPPRNMLILGSGSFSTSDIGKTVEGNGGKAILTSTAGAYSEVTAFTDSSTIASGDWGIFGASANASKGLELSNFSQGFNSPDNWSYDGVLLNLEDSNVTTSPTLSSSATSINFKPDGTVMYVSTYAEDRVYQIALSAPYDLTNASADGNFYLGTQNSVPYDITFKPDGTVMFMLSSSQRVYQYDLSTAWDITSASYTQIGFIPSPGISSTHLKFKPDGTKLFVTYNNSDNIHEIELTTAWDITTMQDVRKFSFSSQSTSPRGFFVTEDGLRLQVQFVDGDEIHEYTLSSPWSLLNASYSGKFLFSVANSSIGSEPESFAYSADGTKVFTVDQGGNARVYQWSSGELFVPTDSYEVAVTNSGGQIDTTTWLDINTMVGDEVTGDGTVSYAVSTDGRTTWSVIKEGTGVRPIVRNNSGTWQYNSNTGNPDAWDVSEATFIQDLNTTPSDQGQAIFFKADGTQYYVLEKDQQRVYKHSLSTAWDVSTASSFEALFYVGSQENSPTGLFFKPDGTKMYTTGHQNARAYEYDLSTAWDITSASFNQSYSMSELSQPSSIIFKPDGTEFYVCNNNGYVYNYSMSTAWDVSSSDFNNNFWLSTGTNEGNPRGLFFKTDGTKMYMLGFQRDTVYEWDLSTAWDVSSASLSTNTLATGGTSGTGLFFSEDGDRLYTIDEGTDRIRQYSIGVYAFTTATDWANSYVNQELPALQQALGASLANRMDKTQLDAVTDPNHFTLGDSLDLMIGLYQGTASANVPSSDGVTINYDAETLNQGAVVGTDYDFDMPTSTKVRVTSNATQNLKIRVV